MRKYQLVTASLTAVLIAGGLAGKVVFAAVNVNHSAVADREHS
jgi:hypothetical protein